MVNANTGHMLTQLVVVLLSASGPGTMKMMTHAWFSYFVYVRFAHEPCAKKDSMTLVLGVPLIGLEGVVGVGVLMSVGQERFTCGSPLHTSGA